MPRASAPFPPRAPLCTFPPASRRRSVGRCERRFEIRDPEIWIQLMHLMGPPLHPPIAMSVMRIDQRARKSGMTQIG